RGGGGGRALVEAFVQAARVAGASEVRLVTTPDGPAAGFYRHLGWHGAGTRLGADGALVEEFRFPL
ncbi:MAG: GNAT family N-acetyltransferase, partial [Nitriliruptoraceae bacterium]|nr:GNAT family N-acetyltransferase [Nitriliruptoraceae bacterium]